jgi:hypothetical protein
VAPPSDAILPAALQRPARALLEAIERAAALGTPESERLVAQLREAVDATHAAARELAGRPEGLPSPGALAAWSHRLREPLTVVVAWTQMLTKEAGDDATRARGTEALERNLRLFLQRLGDVPQ